MDPDSPEYLSKIIILVILLAFSAFFSSSETALTSLSKIRIRAMVDEGLKNAKLIQKVTSDSNRLISTILVGNNLVNIGASAIGTTIATDLFGNRGVGIATGVLTLLVLVFGEVTPKTFAKNNNEVVAQYIIKPIAICMIICKPFVIILNFITSSFFSLLGGKNSDKPTVTVNEFRTMVDVSHEEGLFEGEEKQMITNVVDFRTSTAEEIMIPRIDIVTVSEDITYTELIETFKKDKFTRIPVYSDTNDNIVGIISFKDIMFIDKTEDFKVSDYYKEPYFTYESKPCSKLFTDMKRESLTMVIVLDEYGGTAGIVTLQDLIQEIVGDIETEEEIVAVKGNEFISLGTTKLDDINEALGTNFENDDIESIGGYILGILGRFPKKGEIIEDVQAKFCIEEVNKNRIERLRIVLSVDDEAKEKEN